MKCPFCGETTQLLASGDPDRPTEVYRLDAGTTVRFWSCRTMDGCNQVSATVERMMTARDIPLVKALVGLVDSELLDAAVDTMGWDEADATRKRMELLERATLLA